jgi:hypothetical protein
MIRAALTLPLLLVACGGTKTICGTREAQALDPAINDEIAAAVHSIYYRPIIGGINAA